MSWLWTRHFAGHWILSTPCILFGHMLTGFAGWADRAHTAGDASGTGAASRTCEGWT